MPFWHRRTHERARLLSRSSLVLSNEAVDSPLRDAKVMVAFRLWAHAWVNNKVEVHCDNAAVVSVINSGSSRDPFLAACTRTLWLIKAQYNIIVSVSHIRGKDNVYADILSRWPSMKHTKSPVIHYLRSCTWHTVNTNDLQPDFSI